MPGKGSPVLAQVISRVVKHNGEVELPSSGTSMFPFIREGDKCRFAALGGAEPRIGEVLLVEAANGQLVGHRLCRVEQGADSVQYICKGDSNLRADQPVMRSQIIGRLVLVVKKRYLLRADKGLGRWWGSLVVRLPFLSRLLQAAVHGSKRLGNEKNRHLKRGRSP
jgi:signal peptidase I